MSMPSPFTAGRPRCINMPLSSLMSMTSPGKANRECRRVDHEAQEAEADRHGDGRNDQQAVYLGQPDSAIIGQAEREK